MTKTIPIIAALLTLAALATTDASAQQSRLYDSSGRSVGTATIDSSGTVTRRDARGNVISRETTSGSGVTTVYDSRGRNIGRKQ
jgi:YD repeat-containing protein